VYLQSANEVSEPEFEARVSVGNDDTRSVSMSAGGEVVGGLDGRFSLQRMKSNGFYDNVSLGLDDSNGRDETLLRGKLGWRLSGQWQVRLSLLWADFDNGYDAWAPDNGRITYADNPGRDQQRTTGASLKINGPLGRAVDLVSITGFADSDILFSYDGEWGDADYWAPYLYDYTYRDIRIRQTLSQELRFISNQNSRLFNDRADWLVGVYFQHLDESNDIVSAGIYDDSVDAPFAYCTPCLSDTRLDSAFEARNHALFGKLDIDLTERSRLSLGLRTERWEADYSDRFRDRIYGNPDMPVVNHFSPAKTLWGGDIGLTFELSDSNSLYALVSRGYKAGGFNPSFARVAASAAIDQSAIAFDPESLLNVEAGMRGEWLDGRISGAVSLFHMRRHDMQVRSSAQFTDNPNDFVFITSNASGRSRGLESSLQWQVGPRWTLHGSLGLLSTRIDNFALEREVGVPGSLNGRSFAHAPSWNANLGVSYLDSNRWSARLDWQLMDDFYFDYSHDEQASSRSVVNLRVKRLFDKWDISAWVRNLFDEDYFTRGFYFGLTPPLFVRERFTRLGDPRHYGLTATYRY
ncbi:MAG: TonB-dependent receptor, partial [Gammaproteobacteria bacterium]|nr:TonB-dependent receptor [Gammaproteobacteria bacterium]